MPQGSADRRRWFETVAERPPQPAGRRDGRRATSSTSGRSYSSTSGVSDLLDRRSAPIAEVRKRRASVGGRWLARGRCPRTHQPARPPSRRSGTTCPAKGSCCCPSWRSSSSAPGWCSRSWWSTSTRSAASPSATSVWLIGLGPLIGFLVVGPGGTVIDKYGARVVVIGSLSFLVAGRRGAGVRRQNRAGDDRDHAAGRGVRRVLARLAEPDRRRRPHRAAAALLRGQLHPAQPRHRDRRHHRRPLRRRRATGHLPADLPGRRGDLPARPVPVARPPAPPGRTPGPRRRRRAAAVRVLPRGRCAGRRSRG